MSNIIRSISTRVTRKPHGGERTTVTAFLMLVAIMGLLPEGAHASGWGEGWRADFGPYECYLWRSYSLREQLSDNPLHTRNTIFNVNFRTIVDTEGFFEKNGDDGRLEELKRHGFVGDQIHFVVFTQRPRRNTLVTTAISVNGVEARLLEFPVDPQLSRSDYFLITGSAARDLLEDFVSGDRIEFRITRSDNDEISVIYDEPLAESFSVRKAQFDACVSTLGNE